MTNTPLTTQQFKKVQGLLIPLDFPKYPVECEAGTPETKNANFVTSKYKAYPTNKNVPAEMKGKFADLPKAVDTIEGYEGTVSKEDTSVRQGKGSQMFLDGTVLDGYFQQDEFVKGRLVTPIGDYMTGTFTNDHGVKNIQYKHANFSYEGDLNEDGGLSGVGKLEWQKSPFVCIYQGNFEKNVLKAGKLSIKMNGTVHEVVEGLFEMPLDIKAAFAVKMKSIICKKIAEAKKVAEKKVEPKEEQKVSTPVELKEESPKQVQDSPKVDNKKVVEMQKQCTEIALKNTQLEKELASMQKQVDDVNQSVNVLEATQPKDLKKQQELNRNKLAKSQKDLQASLTQTKTAEKIAVSVVQHKVLSVLESQLENKKKCIDQACSAKYLQFEDQIKLQSGQMTGLRLRLDNASKDFTEMCKQQKKYELSLKQMHDQHSVTESNLKNVVQESLQLTMMRTKTEKELAQLKQTVSAAQKSIEDLQSGAALQQNEAEQSQKAQDELKKEQQKLKNIDSELNEVQKTKDQAKKQLDEKKSKIDSEISSLTEQHTKMQSESDKNQKKQQEAKNLKQKDLELQLNTATDSVKQMNSQVEQVKIELDEKTKQHVDVTRQHEDMKIAQTELKQKMVDQKSSDVDVKKKQDEEHIQKVSSLNTQLTETIKKQEETDKSLSSQKGNTKKLLQEYDEALVSQHALQAEIYSLTMQISLLQGYADQQDQLKQIQQTIKEDQIKCDKVTQQSAAKEADLTKLGNQLRTEKAKLAEDSKRTLEGKQKQVDDLEMQLSKSAGTKVDSNREKSKLESERAKKVKECEKTMSDLKKERDALKVKETQLAARKKTHKESLDKKINEHNVAIVKAQDGVMSQQIIMAILGLVLGLFLSQLIVPKFIS